ncbi:MAG: hypothetical protein ACKVU4_11870 [Phycisphaerales bacterium]
MTDHRINPHRPQPPMHPRKVRGGIRFTRPGSAFPESWAATRWLRLMSDAAEEAVAAEGLQYARLGQARAFSIDPGAIRAVVQGRAPRAYETVVAIDAYTHDQWEAILTAGIDQPVYGARLMSGEFPVAFEELLARRGLSLLPPDAAGLKPRCTCADAGKKPGAWCKHACCAAYLVAERLAEDAFLLFALRGLARDELIERLRQRRALEGAGQDGVPVYTPHVAGVADAQARPLEDLADCFWDAPRADGDSTALDLPMDPPDVSHPLLRRLGPSPFASPDGHGRAPASFPIVGLLATCYDVVSSAVIRRERGDETNPDANPSHESAAEPAGAASDDPSEDD